MRAAPPLWTRILGYGGAIILVAIAVTVVLLQLQADAPGGPSADPSAASTPSAAVPGAVVPGTAGTGGTPGVPAGPSGGAGATSGTTGGSARCGAAVASYQRTGDRVKVSVTLPPSGLVAAFVEAKGRGTLTKSVTAGGERGPHVFEFTGVPAAITRRIGVTVITQAGLQSCDLKAGG